VLNAVFIYQLAVHTGDVRATETTGRGAERRSRIQALLIAFSFGAFIEGCAGFGAPVAISGAMLNRARLQTARSGEAGIDRQYCAGGFRQRGIPLTTLNKVTDLPLDQLSAMVGRAASFFSLLVPFWLVAAQVGLRGMRQVWPACLVCGGTFGIAQFAVSNFHGPWLVDIVAAVISMASLVLLLQFWRPAKTEAVENSNTPIPVETRHLPERFHITRVASLATARGFRGSMEGEAS
jgi:lactate permease